VIATSDDERCRPVARLASQHDGLTLLVLYGSRATGEARPDSDWDFGYLADARFDPATFLADAVGVLGTDAIDLADLARASGQLRYRAAGEARVIFARDEDVFPRFWFDAVTFWCDARPVIQAGYSGVLEGLAR
jgi:predicted nucleotidyltransferase